MTRYRLTVFPPGGEPVRKNWTLTPGVSVYQAMVILMNADPDFEVAEPVDYPIAREFAEKLGKAPSRYEMKHGPTGYTFMIERRD